MPGQRPIGFFDSGVGGLSVMRDVRRLLPSEDMIYYADSVYCPYGVKPPEVIRARAFAISDFLLARGVKMIVIASNTTSIASLDAVRKRVDVPVVGIEPAVKPAVSTTQSKKVGLLATGVTLAGDRFKSLLHRFGNGVEVYTQPCPGLVELVESGRWLGPEAESLLGQYLEPLLARGTDTIVLGCTHYHFLRPIIERMVGSGIRVIDTGEAVARQVIRVLCDNDMVTTRGEAGREYFYTSGEPEEVLPVMKRLWDNNEILIEQARL